MTLSMRTGAVFRAEITAFGAVPPVHRHHDENETARVDIAHAVGVPSAGMTTYATVNLNESPNVMDGRNIPVEIFSVIAGENTDVANALSTCAFNMLKAHWLIAPGVVHEGALRAYPGLAPNLPNMFFVPPMDHAELAHIEVPGGTVYGLQALPISVAETEFLYENGFEKLNGLFIGNDMEYWNLERPSLV